MTTGGLLDTHSLLWLGQSATLRRDAGLEIARLISINQLFTSHISIWETGVAITKKRIHLVPYLGGRSPGAWFAHATKALGASALPRSPEIAAEAALVPAIYNYGDPGDCFLIATARIHNLTLVTRDRRILDLAQRDPSYLNVIPC